MSRDALLSLVNNAALLLALGVLYDALPLRQSPRVGRWARRGAEVGAGLALGAIGMAVMLTPWHFGSGVVFDTRSILLSLAGLFFGLLPTLIATLMTVALRFAQGGPGVWTGIAVIVTSSALGLAWRRWRPPMNTPLLPTPRAGELYLLGLAVHVAMLLWMLTLPSGLARTALSAIALPVLAIYPVATVLLGLLLRRRLVRRETEEALRRERDLLAVVTETAPAGITLVDTSGQIVFANRSAEDILGLAREDITRRAYNDPEWVISDENGGPFADEQTPFRQVMATYEAVYDVVHAIAPPDGRRTLLSINAAPVVDEDGTVSGVVAAMVDITERHRAEVEIRTLTARQQELIHTLQYLAQAHDRSVVMDVVRRAARALVGADGAAFVLREGDACYYAEEDAIAPLWKGQRFPLEECISGWAMEHGEPVVSEDVLADPRIPTDFYRPTFVRSLVMVPMGAPEPLGAIGVYWAQRHRPSPEEVQLLQALANAAAITWENVRLLAELERRVAQRTAQWQRANEELEAFAYSVSHDLRAPLRAIDGFSRLVVDDYGGRLDDEGRRLLGIVRANAQQMDALITDILALSRVTRGEMRRSRVDMTAMAQAMVHEVVAPDARDDITWTLDPLPDAIGDPTLLRQVWANLLSNAYKYTGQEDAPAIHISGWSEGTRHVYCVRDNGVGFDPQYAHKLFGVFQRLHGADEFEGNGVGLAIVQRIVHRHDGEVWAEGAVGQGAAFYFALPVEGGTS
jgi:PAS domain S-box-containing protein